MKSYDVLIWENPPEDNDMPFMLYEVSKEFLDLSYKEALKEYYSNDFTHKQLREYQSSDPDSDGDAIEENTDEEYENLL